MDRLKSFKKHRHGRRIKQVEKFEQKMKEERQKRIRERQKEFFSEIEVHKYVFCLFSSDHSVFSFNLLMLCCRFLCVFLNNGMPLSTIHTLIDLHDNLNFRERLDDVFKIKRERWKGFNKYAKEFHKRKERIHREKIDRIQREKINLLKINDVEGYLRMVQV
jgi:hypothetical protein